MRSRWAFTTQVYLRLSDGSDVRVAGSLDDVRLALDLALLHHSFIAIEGAEETRLVNPLHVVFVFEREEQEEG